MKVLWTVTLAAIFALAGHAALAFPGSRGDGKVIRMTSDENSRSWLGVSVMDLSSDKMKDLGLKNREGAYVSDVMDKSPAKSAGIKEGDVITRFNGEPIHDADGLVEAVRKADPGAKVKITVARKGDTKDLVATLEKAPRSRANFAFTPPNIRHHIRVFRGPTIGLAVIPLSRQLGKYFEAPDNKGLLVEEVAEGSAAEKAGFKAGDVITKIGDVPVTKLNDFRSELAEHNVGDKVNVDILRKGSAKTLTVEIEKDNDEGYEFSFDDSYAPDVDLDIPEIDHLRDFEFNMDELRPELERLQRELNRLKERIGERIRQKIDQEGRVPSEI